MDYISSYFIYLILLITQTNIYLVFLSRSKLSHITETTEALIEALQQFKGGVLLVSHDQHLLTNVCKDLYVVENGTVERLAGGMANEAFEAYKKAVVQGKR